MRHRLKTLPAYFNETLHGRKNFEVRIDDRGYVLGDFVVLEEWTPEGGYTGRSLERAIVYILRKVEGCRHGAGLESGWVVLGFPNTPL